MGVLDHTASQQLNEALLTRTTTAGDVPDCLAVSFTLTTAILTPH